MEIKKILFMIIMIFMFSSIIFAAENPILKIDVAKTDPIVAVSGEYVYIWLKIDNIGTGDAKNLEIELVEAYPFKIVGDSKKEIVSLGSNEDYVTKFKLLVDEEAVSGEHALKVRFIHDQLLGSFSEKEMMIEVESVTPELLIGQIISDPVNLISDLEDVKLSVNLQNIGESDAKLIKTKLLLPEGFTSSNSFSDMYNIASIGSESGSNAEFYIDIDEDVKEGAYEAKLEVSYKKENNEEYVTKVLDLMLPVKATPKFEIVEVVSNPENLRPNSNVELLITLENIGGKDADSVSIRGYKSVSLPIDFEEKSNYIGKVRSGQQGQGVLKFTVDKDAVAKKYLLDVEIRCVVDDQVRVYDKTIEFEILDGVNSGDGLIKYVLIGIGIIVLVGLVFLFKKRK